ncbi:HAD family hydrolase [Gemmata sp. JC717]|uniref:HAD family hydrolase n=1 Tax=Gemmata algarum TaxID=2975278 RepID=UPI0021BB6B87|nr:HAD family hydrolase [Gemmata algarum]MDY3555866.1 HAD family hydrolase [Gemmata algarum]
MARIPSGVRAVFFDAVGTLIFPEPSAPAVYAAVARGHGLDLPASEVRERFLAAYRQEEAVDADRNWATSEAREHERWRTIVTSALVGVSDPDACFAHLFEHYARPGAWRVHPDAAEVLGALSARGVVLGMGSNYDARLLTVLDGHPELAPLRDRVVVSAAVGWRKPAREFFAEVSRVAGCAPAEVLFVGDDLRNDYEGATAAGMHALLLDPDARHTHVPHRATGLAELIS